MDSFKILSGIMEDTIKEMYGAIDCLCKASDPCAKAMLINCLRKNTAILQAYIEGMQEGGSTVPAQRTFTVSELSTMNGKNGNPAYVAVNGTVYDVTNTAAWGGASHFGLTAGRDVTSQFQSCHLGQPVLSKLNVVGKMV